LPIRRYRKTTPFIAREALLFLAFSFALTTQISGGWQPPPDGRNAASVAGLLLTTEALITEEPEKPKSRAGAPGMPEHMDDMDY
jgi:hypothetical protein